MAKRKKSEVNPVALATLLTLGLAIRFWYLVVPALVGALVLVSSSRRKNEERLQVELHESEVADLVAKLRKDLDYAKNGKSLKTRLSNCDDALQILSALDSLDTTNVVTNKSELREEVMRLKRVMPVVELIEKQDRYRVTQEVKREVRVLREVVYQIQMHGISDEDLQLVRPESRVLGGKVSLSDFEARLRALEA